MNGEYKNTTNIQIKGEDVELSLECSWWGDTKANEFNIFIGKDCCFTPDVNESFDSTSRVLWNGLMK